MSEELQCLTRKIDSFLSQQNEIVEQISDMDKLIEIAVKNYDLLKESFAFIIANAIFLIEFESNECRYFNEVIEKNNEADDEEETVFPLKCSCCKVCNFLSKVSELSDYYSFDISLKLCSLMKANNFASCMTNFIGDYQTAQFFLVYRNLEKMFTLKDCKSAKLYRVDELVLEAICAVIFRFRVLNTSFDNSDLNVFLSKDTTAVEKETLLCSIFAKELTPYKKLEINFGAKANVSGKFTSESLKSLKQLTEEMPKITLLAITDVVSEIADSIEERKSCEVSYTPLMFAKSNEDTATNIYGEDKEQDESDRKLLYDFVEEEDYKTPYEKIEKKVQEEPKLLGNGGIIRFSITLTSHLKIIQKAIETLSHKLLICMKYDYSNRKKKKDDISVTKRGNQGLALRLAAIVSIAEYARPPVFRDVKALKIPKQEKTIYGRNGKKKYFRAGKRITAKRNKIRMMIASQLAETTKMDSFLENEKN